MVMVEGRGVVPPKPVEIPIDRHTRVFLSMEAEKRASHRRYGGGGQWQRGFLKAEDGVSKAAHPILVGCMGEWAFAEYVNSRVGRRLCETDLSLNEMGDDGNDFVICGTRHQLKTRQKRTGANYVRRVTEQRRLCGLTVGRYVFAQWNWREERCLLLGWCSHEVVRNCRHKRSPVAGHFNLEVPPELLRPMDRLICEVKSDMALEAVAWH